MFKFTWQRRVVAATPLISLLIFLTLGLVWGLWHPGWLAFLLIPIVPYFVGLKQFRMTFSLLIVVIFVVLGSFGYWHPGWLVFLLIPIYHILFPADTKLFVKAETKPKKHYDIEQED